MINNEKYYTQCLKKVKYRPFNSLSVIQNIDFEYKPCNIVNLSNLNFAI